MKRRMLAISAVMMCLTGCSKYQTMSNQQLNDYLNTRYQNDFAILSMETRDFTHNDYLDPEMDTVGVPEETSDGFPTYVFTMCDTDGIVFHVTVMRRLGALSAHYVYTDDYSWQWLKAKPQFQEWLENSPFPLTYVNEIGIDYDAGAVCYLYISDNKEIEEAVAYAYEIVADPELLLPDLGCDREDIDASIIRPCIEIRFEQPDDTSWFLYKLRFRSEGSPLLESQETVCAESRQRYSDYISIERMKRNNKTD